MSSSDGVDWSDPTVDDMVAAGFIVWFFMAIIYAIIKLLQYLYGEWWGPLSFLLKWIVIIIVAIFAAIFLFLLTGYTIHKIHVWLN